MSGLQSLGSRLWLGASYGWTVLCGVAAFTIPAVRTSTIPRIHETLFQFSHYVVILCGSLAVVMLVIATVELARRISTRNMARGIVTTIFATLLIAFSMLGFVAGALSIGVVGLFALLSAMPMKESTRSV